MSVHNDFTLLNAGIAGNFGITSDFDSPTVNDSSSTTPIYIEGNACCFWPLKKGITNGYTATSTITGTPSMTGRLLVGWINYPYADIDLIPINAINIRISSSTGFTTNYYQWDALAQFASPYNVPISGHVPVMAYPTNPDATNGTFNAGSIESVGWVATSGNDADGKQGGFDMFFLISYVGGHSETWASDFYDDIALDVTPAAIPNTTSRPLAVFTKSGAFYRSNVRVAVGNDVAANTTVVEESKTVFFDNVEPEQDLGFTLLGGSTGQVNLTLTSCVHFWNSQLSTHSIFENVAEADIFRVEGCSFALGGKTILAAHISDANTYVKTSNFTACQRIEPNTMLFEGNTISDTADTAAASGALLLASTSHRVSGGTISKGTAASHAIVITVAGTYSLDDLTFIGYNVANGNADSTIRNESGGAVIINASGITGNLTYQNGAGATTTINNNVAVTLAGMKDNTEVRVCAAGTQTALAGIENATVGTTDDRSFTFSLGAGVDVDIAVFNVAWVLPPNNRIDNFTIPGAAATIPLSQVFDRTYENPV